MRCVFSVAYNVFVEIVTQVEQLVLNAVLPTKQGHLATVWPPCFYRTVSEPKLIFSVLGSMDGNSSLKRVFRTSRDTNLLSLSVGMARLDKHARTADFFVEAEAVDIFKDEVKSRTKPSLAVPADDGESNNDTQAASQAGQRVTEGTPVDGIEETTTCSD